MRAAQRGRGRRGAARVGRARGRAASSAAAELAGDFREVELERERKKQRPEFSLERARGLTRERFGIPVQELKPLSSYDDQNFMVAAEGGERFLLKFHNGVESAQPEFLAGQTELYRQLRRHGITAPHPRPPAGGGAAALLWADGSGDVHGSYPGGLAHAVRLLDWVPGRLLSEAGSAALASYELAGAYLARLRQALDRIAHPGLRRSHLWDLRQTGLLTHFIDVLGDGSGQDAGGRRVLVEEVLERFRAAAPTLAGLRRGLLQGDYNDANVVVAECGTRVSGVIDFGDCVTSWRVGDLAVGAAYACIALSGAARGDSGSPQAGDTLGGARALVQAAAGGGYGLDDAERGVLPLLCACRLATSATMGMYTYQRSLEENPDMPQEQRDYLLTHATPAWDALLSVLGAIRDGSAAERLGVASA